MGPCGAKTAAEPFAGRPSGRATRAARAPSVPAMSAFQAHPEEPETGLRSGTTGQIGGLGSSALGPDSSDHELVRAAQGGEELAFQLLVERHQGRAFRVARQMVPGRDDALDLAQEAFLRVFKSLHRFDFNHEFTTWLYRIVSNLSIDHLRRRRPIVGGGGLDDEEAQVPEVVDERVAAPFERMEVAETGQRVRDCIESLAPHFRAVLALRELEGLPCTEIARIVGATHVTVRWRLHRARKLFQEEWERRDRQVDLGGDTCPPDSTRPLSARETQTDPQSPDDAGDPRAASGGDR